MKQGFEQFPSPAATREWDGARSSFPERRAAHRRDAVPDYLARSYWWAYMSPPAVRFFDHQPVINAILFGQYRKLVKTCLDALRPEEAGRTLQLAAVYGILTPTLASRLPPGALHLADVLPIQLEGVRRKLDAMGHPAHLMQANVESLPCPDARFDTVLVFFLLHELPPAARRRVLREAVRTLRPGGTLVIADYGELTRPHVLHRIPPLRLLIERVEPYLGDFWRLDLTRLVEACAADVGRTTELDAHREVFDGFYRVHRYRIGT